MLAIVDCNSFYCSCERLFRPDLWNKPVVVLSNNDGCIVARTDEAKKLGVGMAGPYYQNKDLIEKNGIAVFSSNYNLYGDISWRVMETLRQLMPPGAVEVYSVDECFVDFSHIKPKDYYKMAAHIRDTVELWTGIKVSIGVATSKVLSKVANRLAKKNKKETGCIIILDNDELVIDALQRTAIGDVWGVGRKYADKCESWFGIQNALQLSQMSEGWAQKNLGGVVGVRLIKELNGTPCIPMKDPLENKKMIATTRMFGKPVYDKASVKEAVATYTARAAEKLRRQRSAASILSVFVVTNPVQGQQYDYSPKGKSCYTILDIATSDTLTLIKNALPLVDKIFYEGPKYLKAGIVLSGLVPDTSIQGNLFAPATNNQKQLMNAIDNLNFSMRDDIIKYASSGTTRNWKMRQELRSKRYTTRWNEVFVVK